MTEIPPAIALIFEPSERDIMRRPPRRLSARLVTPALLGYSYCIAGSLISIGCLVSYLSVFWYNNFLTYDLFFTANHHWTQNSTIMTASSTGQDFDGSAQLKIYEQACAAWHICLVFSQIFNLLSCTTRRTSLLKHGIRNPILIAAIAIKLVIIFSFVFIPPLQWIVGVQPPPFFVWFIPLVVGFVLLLVNEVSVLADKYSLIYVFRFANFSYVAVHTICLFECCVGKFALFILVFILERNGYFAHLTVSCFHSSNTCTRIPVNFVYFIIQYTNEQ